MWHTLAYIQDAEPLARWEMYEASRPVSIIISHEQTIRFDNYVILHISLAQKRDKGFKYEHPISS